MPVVGNDSGVFVGNRLGRNGGGFLGIDNGPKAIF
jgi:hypothetical protein